MKQKQTFFSAVLAVVLFVADDLETVFAVLVGAFLTAGAFFTVSAFLAGAAFLTGAGSTFCNIGQFVIHKITA